MTRKHAVAEAPRVNYKGFAEFPYRKVIVISPHPDDSVLGCGGLVGRLSRLRPEVEIHIVVMLPGYDGVEESYLVRTLQQARDRKSVRQAVAQWLNPHPDLLERGFMEMTDRLPITGNPAALDLLGQALRTVVGFDRYVRDKDSGSGLTARKRKTVVNFLRTALRYGEVLNELNELKAFLPYGAPVLHFLALPILYNRRIDPAEMRQFALELRRVVGPGDPGNLQHLLLAPHPKDPQPAHRICTFAANRAVPCESDWTIWYYQSPWYTLPADDIHVVVELDAGAMGHKQAGAAQHRSQIARTPYHEIVRHQARLLAETLPELLLSFGAGQRWPFGEHCEVYSMEGHAFFYPDGRAVDVYRDG